MTIPTFTHHYLGNMIKGLSALLLAAVVQACGGDSDSDEEAIAVADPSPTPIVVIPPPSEQTFKVTLTSLWSPEDHLSRPSNAHFSGITAVSHNAEYRLLPLGEIASSGFELVAELGSQTNLIQEAEAARANLNVQEIVTTTDQFVPGTLTQEFQVVITQDYPLLSFVAMIAPSPDWVIGTDSLPLVTDSDEFVDSAITVDLYAIDGGTEEGDTPGNFSLNNDATDPKEPIKILDVSTSGFDKPFARAVIEPAAANEVLN